MRFCKLVARARGQETRALRTKSPVACQSSTGHIDLVMRAAITTQPTVKSLTLQWPMRNVVRARRCVDAAKKCRSGCALHGRCRSRVGHRAHHLHDPTQPLGLYSTQLYRGNISEGHVHIDNLDYQFQNARPRSTEPAPTSQLLHFCENNPHTEAVFSHSPLSSSCTPVHPSRPRPMLVFVAPLCHPPAPSPSLASRSVRQLNSCSSFRFKTVNSRF